MNATTEHALRNWLTSQPDRAAWHVADLGSYNVNGQVRDIMPENILVGYDVLQGPGVDYVLADPPYVPAEHRGQYDLVTSCGVMMIAEHPEWIRDEAAALLKPDGWVFLTCCAPACGCKHTTPWGDDHTRFSANDLILLMRPRFVVDKVWPTEHPEVVYTGRRRP